MIKGSENKNFIKPYEKPTNSLACYFAATGSLNGWLFCMVFLVGVE